MKAYLAGPMRGYPKLNFPAFFEVAGRLRDLNHEVISPAEIDDEEDRRAALESLDGKEYTNNKTWGDFLARDVKLIADSGLDAIIFLPNWERSNGARLEAFVGLLGKLNFFQWVEGVLVELSKEYVAGVVIAEWMPDHIKKMAQIAA